MASLSGVWNTQNFTDLGAFAVGGRLYTFSAGTTTHKTAYTDEAGTIAHSYTNDGSGGQYIALNARGELPAPLFLTSGAYDLAYKTAAGATVWTRRARGAGEDATAAVAALIADLDNESDVAKGPALVAFNKSLAYPQGTVGHALRWAHAVNVREYGATGDGTTDDTAAMAAAHATGRLVYYPAGRYKFSRLSTSIAAGGIIGDGQEKTILETTNVGSENLMTFTGGGTGGPAGSVVFRDFQIVGVFSSGTPSKTAGAAIVINPGTGLQNNYSLFDNVTVYGIPIGFDLVRSEMCVIRACKLLACPEVGVQLANYYNIDGGDTVITECTFSNPFTYGVGVKQKHSGGLRLTNNKILGGSIGYLLAYEAVAGDAGPASTGILLICNNSIENQASTGISFTRVSGSNPWYYTLVGYNELAGMPSGIVSDSSAFLQQINVSDNTIQLAGSGTPLGIALVGANQVLVDNNSLKANGGTTPIGVYLASCIDAKVGKNLYNGFAVGDAVKLITPGANNSVDYDEQAGTAVSSTSSWAAYGSCFRSPLITVTFPTAFKNTPAATDVIFTSNALNGELGGVVNSVTATTLTFYAVSSITSIAASINWRVKGIL
jgi:hypothetical protein